MAALQKTTNLTATVVIPTFQRAQLALSLAKQIRTIDRKIEIIIVDQENKKPLDEELQKKYKIKYFNLKQANTSRAKNKGIEEAQGEIIIFFDDDVEITDKTIKAHLNVYNNPKVVGVAGRVIIDNEKIPDKKDVDTGQTNLFGTKFLYQFWSTKKQKVGFVYGCNMSFRKKILIKCGKFDKNFPKIFEEVDLSKRIKKFGEIIFEPIALAYHHKAPSGGIRPEEKINKQKLIFYNYGHYLAKNIFFPISLISFFLRIRTALKFSYKIVLDLIKGYSQSFLINNWFFFVLILIIFVRLWKVPNFFIFTFSEEWQGTLAWELVKNFHIIWIGVSQANIHYYLGPGFIYLNYLLFIIGKGDPAILAYFSAILGIITVFGLYFITKELFSQKIAVLTTIIYGFSTLINYYDRRFWNPSFIPIFSLLFIYSLIKARRDTRWFILTAGLIGASFHFHLLLLLFLIPAFYSVISNVKKIKWTTWIFMFATYIVLVSPLIVFDIVHNYDNFLAPFRIIFGKGQNELYPSSIGNILSHFNTLVSTFGRIWFTKLNTNLQTIALETETFKIPGNLFLSIISIIALIWFFLKNRNDGYQIFFIYIFTIISAFIIYPSYNPEYYLMGFITLMTIVIGFWLNSLPKILAIPIIVFFIIVNILTVITTTDDYGLKMKKQVIKKTLNITKNKNFSLEHTGQLVNPQYSYAGWRLLFKLYGKTPVKTNVDSVLGWIYPDEISSEEPPIRVIISEDPLTIKDKIITQFNQGVYYCYIINNE